MRSLFSKVLLAQLLTLFVALGTVSLLLSTALHRLLSPIYMELAAHDLVMQARSMAQQFDPLVSDPDRQEELTELRHLFETSTHTEICLVGPSGEEQDGHTGPATEQVPAGATRLYPGGVARCGEDTLVAHVLLPGGRGSLFVRASVSAVIDTTVGRLRNLVLYAGLVAVALALLVALGLSERISVPLRRMRRLAGRMAAGDFSQRLNIKTKDEVGALAQSFDSLADSLRNTMGELQAEQGRLRGILASVAEGIIAVDAEGQISLINPQAASLLNVDQQRSPGSKLSELKLPETVAEQFAECLRTRKLCTVEFKLERPERNLVVQVAPVRTGESEDWGAVAVLRDVTESRRLEQMRRQFISDASHEIRTPLTSIGGFAAAIADGTASTPEERTRSASVIVREVERLTRLVRDLLDLSRIESGAVTLTMEDVDLNDLIQAAVESFETQTREKGLTVEIDLPSDLPSVRGDADRLYQVIVNLFSNALRFNRDQGRIIVVGREAEGQVRIEVRDTGAGIPEHDLPHIWERFHRADPSRAREEGGTGLGLAIVRSIVEAHGGTVSAESVVGKGSTLSFTLPLA